jgi:RNA polymerase primary sigma factor
MRQFKISKESTTKRNEVLNRYFFEISKYPVLSPSEEFKISTEARLGNQKAIETLVRSNLRFVISVAKMYGGKDPILLADLINEGNIGLVEAAQLFDPTTGFKFISYAVWHIRKNMTKYLSDNSRTVRLPLNKIDALRQIRNIESTMSNRLDREPTSDEMVEEYIKNSPTSLKLKNTDGVFNSIKELIDAGGSSIPLEGDSSDPDRDFGPIEYINGDLDGTDYLVLKEDSIKTLNSLLSLLNSREREVIIKRFGIGGIIPEPRDIVAKRLDVSVETIRNWEVRIIRKLFKLSRKTGISKEMLS